MVKKLTAIFLFLLFSGSLSSPARAGSQDFTLVNRTGMDIYELYIAPYQSEEWEEVPLDEAYLADGARLTVSLTNRKKTYWDIMVGDDEGNKVCWRKLNLKKIAVITLSYDGKDVWAEYE